MSLKIFCQPPDREFCLNTELFCAGTQTREITRYCFSILLNTKKFRLDQLKPNY